MFLAAFRQPSFIRTRRQNKRAADRSAAPISLERITYFKFVIAVRSAESLATPALPHQFEPAPVGLIGVTLVVPVALKALVKPLQLPFDRSVPEQRSPPLNTFYVNPTPLS